ncbi:MAG: hypothetical protein ACLP66_24275 [Polyangia bacterium]
MARRTKAGDPKVAVGCVRVSTDDKLTEEEMEAAAEDADNDDLPMADLPPGLVAALAAAGVKTKKDWDDL